MQYDYTYKCELIFHSYIHGYFQNLQTKDVKKAHTLCVMECEGVKGKK